MIGELSPDGSLRPVRGAAHGHRPAKHRASA